MTGFLLQTIDGQASFESRTVLKHCFMNDLPSKKLDIETSTPDQIKDLIFKDDLTPVGSVEFLQHIMRVCGIQEPKNLSYPDVLMDKPYWGRHIWLCDVNTAPTRGFIKPMATKVFTGYVRPPESLYSRLNEDVFLSLPPDEPIYASEMVNFMAEWRIYVHNDTIMGSGRYDEHPEEDVSFSYTILSKAIEDFKGHSPVAYALDIGYTYDGRTLLVEFNDFWAIGLYKPFDLKYNDYSKMLQDRWNQIKQGERI